MSGLTGEFAGQALFGGASNRVVAAALPKRTSLRVETKVDIRATPRRWHGINYVRRHTPHITVITTRSGFYLDTALNERIRTRYTTFAAGAQPQFGVDTELSHSLTTKLSILYHANKQSKMNRKQLFVMATHPSSFEAL
jgi:hypothetical protein